MASAIVEVRVDYRVIAALARAYAASGRSPTTVGWTKSDLIRQIFIDYQEILMQCGKSQPVESLEEAVEMMRELGYGFLTAGKKGQKQLAMGLSKEDVLPIVEANSARDPKLYLETMDLLREGFLHEDNGRDHSHSNTDKSSS